MEKEQHTIGQGVLTQHADERRLGRYGVVYLIAENLGDSPPVELSVGEYDGRLGTLFAEMVELANLDRHGRARPEAARVGEVVELGTGKLFAEGAYRDPDRGVDVLGAGVRPTDGRESDWMDSMALYRVGHQRVRLFFVPA